MNIMIDIETLSSRKDAAVIAIGACAFDANDIVGEFEVLLDARLSPGRRDEDTLKWWQSQPPEVWQRMIGGGALPRDACTQLAEFIYRQPGGTPRVWANAPTFDCDILRTLYEVVGMEVPWHFRDERCYRTLLALHRLHGSYDSAAIEAVYATRTAHDALSDAVCQARVVQLACRRMGVTL